MELAETVDSSLWRLGDSGFPVFISHSREGAEVLTDGRFVGLQFRNRVTQALETALQQLLTVDGCVRDALRKPGTLTILRGGLNFGLNDAVERAAGVPPTASFMTSQRTVVGGRAQISDDSYRRFNLNDAKCLVIGDIAATGMTIVNALSRLVFESHEKEDLEVVIVTIGTRRFIDRLAAFMDSPDGLVLLGRGWKFSVVFLEAAFGVYTGPGTDLGRLPLTDFVRAGAVSSKPFIELSASDPTSLLERCTIYDGGVRGFEPVDHLSGIESYWHRLRELSLAREGGFEKFLEERGLYSPPVSSDKRLKEVEALIPNKNPYPSLSIADWADLVERRASETRL